MAIKPLPTDQSAYVGTDGKPATVFYTWLKSLADAVNGLLALFPGGTSTTVWTAYTPIATAGTGTITTYTATGRSYQVGKIVFVQFEVDITNNGTGASSIHVTLPIIPNGSFSYVLSGFEANAFEIALIGLISAGSGFAKVVDVNNGYPGAAGAQIICTGTYEAA